jgi:hypothetical protein
MLLEYIDDQDNQYIWSAVRTRVGAHARAHLDATQSCCMCWLTRSQAI